MFVLLGSAGQITSRLARLLLSQRQPVRVIGRHAASLASLAAAGAETAIGDAADAEFLTRAFSGARAAYLMLPPGYDAPDMAAAGDRCGEAIARAISANVAHGLRRVVHLSSIGAERPAGTGPVALLHRQERRLDAIDGLDLLHLRAAWFMENLLPLAAGVAAAGVLASLEAPDAALPMVATADIAEVAARELQQPVQRGVRLLRTDRLWTMREAAAVLGAAIGQPGLAYVQAGESETREQLRAIGFSDSAIDELAALARWLSGDTAPSLAAAPTLSQPTTLERFAQTVWAARITPVRSSPRGSPRPSA